MFAPGTAIRVTSPGTLPATIYLFLIMRFPQAPEARGAGGKWGLSTFNHINNLDIN